MAEQVGGDATETEHGAKTELVGGGPQEPNEPRDPSTAGRAKRAARAVKVAAGHAALVPRSSSVAVAKVIEQAVATSANTPARMARFALGAPVGFILSIPLAHLMALFYPLSAPAALLWIVLPMTMATCVAFARWFPLKDTFTDEEHTKLEHAQFFLKATNDALDLRAAQMRQNGVPGPEIETALAPERNRAQAEYFQALGELRGGGVKKLGPGGDDDPQPLA